MYNKYYFRSWKTFSDMKFEFLWIWADSEGQILDHDKLFPCHERKFATLYLRKYKNTKKTFQVNFGVSRLTFKWLHCLTLKNVCIHWDQFQPVRSLIGKFLVYTNYLSSVWLVELILVYTGIFHCTQCNHSNVNPDTPDLSWNVLKPNYSKLGRLT